jgi:hypothetical protein
MRTPPAVAMGQCLDVDTTSRQLRGTLERHHDTLIELFDPA